MVTSKSDQEKIREVEDLFDFIMRYQDKVAVDATNAKERKEGEGRKAVLLVRGENKWVRIFQVCGGRLIPQDKVDGARTVIVFEGVEGFLQVCKELLAGNPAAFSRARARGVVKVEGDYAIRDASVFNRLLSNVGRILTSYDVKVGDA